MTLPRYVLADDGFKLALFVGCDAEQLDEPVIG